MTSDTTGRFEEARMDQTQARALLAGERARLERLLRAEADEPKQPGGCKPTRWPS